MNAPAEPTATPTTTKRPGRRIAAAIVLSLLIFVGLWLAAFTWLTALLIGSGFFVVVVAAGTVFDVVAMILEAIAAVVFVVLGAIAAVVGAIFSLFG